MDVPLTGRSGPPDCPPTGPAPEECGHERFITVADPLNETQQTATANWNFTIATDWDDIGCVDPPEGSPNPGAFVSIAPSVLDMDQTGLGSFLSMSEADFTAGGVPKSFRLALGAKTITRDSRNGANQTLLTAAGKMLTNEGDFRPGNGLYYGGRLSCRVNEVAFDLVSTAPHVLCRNQKEGSGYSDLKQTMKDKLAELYTVLDNANVCYALTSGKRSAADQQELRDDWHDIADKPAGDTRSQADICAALTPRFIQCPTDWTAAGVAKGGPAGPGNSRHNVGEAVDLRLSFGAVTGNFDPTPSQRKEDIRSHFKGLVNQVDDLCESPSSDPGHIELPYKTAGEPRPLPLRGRRAGLREEEAPRQAPPQGTGRGEGVRGSGQVRAPLRRPEGRGHLPGLGGGPLQEGPPQHALQARHPWRGGTPVHLPHQARRDGAQATARGRAGAEDALQVGRGATAAA